MKIELRQAKYEDYSYLYELKKRTLKKYISNTWGWDENWQKKYFSTNFNPDLLKIIIKGGNEIGCISIIDEDNQIFLSLIEILPEYQNQGIGSKLIKDLLIKAENLNKPVYLQVLKTNEKVKKLYLRLGFSIIEETKTHFKMIKEI
ncbi:MAG: GNAT family N-acetyltransferase [Candidatus Thorarchaeota archaeon]